jgi:hypothetical protein
LWLRFRSIPHTFFGSSFHMRFSLIYIDSWNPESSQTIVLLQ